ncbi:TetR family transcriptional regulator [Streptomyces eurocidicus]|uniref:AcrR family transcriptional regulator n=1 Tax=Streptomyces eurocidicus TaxID=66423 RepID=A0A2N8NRB1_STREU|nr:TetR/AcrR family transcriptional regulator [Streptomyces eurocidicus]MBB5117102.1 AcrR family transcriptional regulator [Streptomyces eurocidicus]MBF6052602.1 TetR family transcriptional regulator [Streptomyces eurocidicus]PNE31302.1 TetR family transcriptional regulator [Streptomyces eurocidicus]
MPAAREHLLDAAFAALGSRPWSGVRMVDVAAAAGVSRQTLYNEFGSKDGLARALVRRETETFLAGVVKALAGAGPGADAADRCAAGAVWILRTARVNPLVRAALTGSRGDRLPAAAAPADPARRVVPGSAAARATPTPGALADGVRDRVIEAVTAGEADTEGAAEAAGDRAAGPSGGAGRPVGAVPWACEMAVRLTLSYIVAPAGPDDGAAADVARLVRALVGDGRGAGFT